MTLGVFVTIISHVLTIPQANFIYGRSKFRINAKSIKLYDAL